MRSAGSNVAFSGTDLRGPALNCQTTPSVRPLKWQLEHDCHPSEDRRSVVGWAVPAGASNLPREEKNTSAPAVFDLLRAPGCRQRRRADRVDHAVAGQVDDGDVARDEVRHVGARAAGDDGDALRVLARLVAARGRVRRVVEVDVAGRVGIDGVAQRAVRADPHLDHEVAAGGHGVGDARSAGAREAHRPRVREEELLLAGLRLAGAEVEVGEAGRRSPARSRG